MEGLNPGSDGKGSNIKFIPFHVAHIILIKVRI